MAPFCSSVVVDKAWQQLWRGKDPVYVKFNFSSPEKSRKLKRSNSCSSELSLDLADLLDSPQRSVGHPNGSVETLLSPPKGKLWTAGVLWPDDKAVKKTPQKIRTPQRSVVFSADTVASIRTPPRTAGSSSKNQTPQRAMVSTSSSISVPQTCTNTAAAAAKNSPAVSPTRNNSVNNGQSCRRQTDCHPGGAVTKQFKDLGRRNRANSSQSFSNTQNSRDLSSSSSGPSSPLLASPSANLIERHKVWLMSPGGSTPISPRLLLQPQSPPKKKIQILQSIAYK